MITSKFSSSKTRFIPLLLAVALISYTHATAQEVDVSDFQFWNETTFTIPVLKKKDANGQESDRLNLIALGVLRFGHNRPGLIDRRFGVGFDLILNKYVSFSPTYVYRRADPDRDEKEYEHRLRFDLNLEKKWKTFSLKDRNRFEYRIRNSRSDSSRYRNRLTLSVPIKRGAKTLFTAYGSNEIYYEFDQNAIGANEIHAGISKPLSKAVTTEIFYVRRDLREGSVKYFNGIGVNFKVRLD